MFPLRPLILALVVAAVLLCGAGAPAQETVLMPRGTSWKYLDNGELPDSPGWVEPAFDDLLWKSGAAPLGYGDGEFATALKFGDDSAKKVISYYFRTKLSIPDPAEFTYIHMRLRRDDGAVVYLNGQEILRSNMPLGEIQPDTFSTHIVGTSEEKLFFDYPLTPNLFVAGENTLAVRVHQRDGTSTDIHFDVEISGVKGLGTLQLRYKPEGWYSNFRSALGAAYIHRAPLMIHFHSATNPDSVRMNTETFRDEEVDLLLSSKLVRYHVDVDRLADRTGLDFYGVRGVPATILFDTNVRPLARIDGFLDGTQFTERLKATGLVR